MIRVFLSWSGKRSREMASALYDWLPHLIQMLSRGFREKPLPLTKAAFTIVNSTSPQGAEMCQLFEELWASGSPMSLVYERLK